MRDLDLAALRKTAEAATQGYWDAVAMGSEGYHVMAPNPDSPIRRIRVAALTHERWENDRANAEYLAAFSPSTVLALLDRLAELEGV